MMFKMPGWKPEELGGIQPPKEVTPQTFHKYDTEISSGLTNYAFFQFVLVLLTTTSFLIFQSKTPFNENWLLKIGAASLIIVSLVNIGGIFERRTWVVVFEYLRIAATGLFLVLFFLHFSLMTISIMVALISVLSLLWFTKFRNEFTLKTS